MATRAQIQANRRNSKLSKGPRNTDLTRFNGLKHGLCAVEVGLPGEDPAEVQAEFDGWRDDWRPMTHTSPSSSTSPPSPPGGSDAPSAPGSAVRAPPRRRRRTSAFDSDRLAAVEHAHRPLRRRPRRRPLAARVFTALGIDRLLTSWGELDASLEDGPGPAGTSGSTCG